MSFWKLVPLIALCLSVNFWICTRSRSEKIEKEDVDKLKLAIDNDRSGFPASCALPQVHPWGEEIMKHVDLDYHFEDNWSGMIQTSLKNGIVEVRAPWFSLVRCYGRCIFKETERTNKYGKWKGVETKFDCDLVHVKCTNFFLFLFPYPYQRVHAQIVPKNTTVLPKKEKFNIFVILIDSLAHTQSYRSLPKTLFFLKETFGAISFPFVNKVGMNSRPNGFPLYFGKSVEGVGNAPSDLGDVCQLELDRYRGILDDVKDEGYMTFYSDDSPTSFYAYPDCAGFVKEISDHTLTPLIKEIYNTNLMPLYYTFDHDFRPMRQRLSLLLMDAFEQFVQAYRGPKFGWLWTSEMSHDRQSTSVMLDTSLYKMLIRNQKELDNSFVFVLGDHGLRFGEETMTKTGKLDINNPALTVSIPRALRGTKTLEVMRKNAEKLQTHYDTRATWLDIAKFLAEDTPAKIQGEKGESYLRNQSNERTCKALPIPPIYCICDNERQSLHVNSSEAVMMGRRVIAELNNFIYDVDPRNVEICGKWIFSEVLSLEGLVPVPKSGIFYITVAVNAPYAGAIFETIIAVRPDGTMDVGAIDRRDQYGQSGACSTIPKICHCM